MTNTLVDYPVLTKFAVDLIHMHLGLPVCVVTDIPHLSVGQDHTILLMTSRAPSTRYFHEYERDVPWNNSGRELAWELTPYQHTLVLDVDYLVMSPRLLKYIDLPLGVPHLLLNYGQDTDVGYTCFGNSNLPQYWASVIAFDKSSPEAIEFFATWQTVKRSWPFYATMFNLDQSLYRNDFAVTVALMYSDATRVAKDFAEPLLNLPLGCAITKLSAHSVDIKSSEGYERTLVGQDMHVQNKKDLEEAILAYYEASRG